MKRRTLLGGVTVLVAGGAVWRAFDQHVLSPGEGPAYEPWDDWRNSSAKADPLALVKSAILAASPHNTQPWLFKVQPPAIELYLDTQRNVGALDPYLREATLGMGCALENLLLAARAHERLTSLELGSGELEPIPAEPKRVLVARVDDVGQAEVEDDSLYRAIPHRHTNRNPYDPQQPLAADFLDKLAHLTGNEKDVKILLFTQPVDRERIVELSSKANRELYSDPQVEESSQRWIRSEWSELQHYRDGITIDATGTPPATAMLAKMMPERMFRWVASHQPAGAYSDWMKHAPLIGMVAVRDRYDREQTLQAGRIWQRAHLLATVHGVAARPNNEAVEMVDHERILGHEARHAAMLSEIATKDWQPTFIFCMGHSTLPARPSPRHPASSVVFSR